MTPKVSVIIPIYNCEEYLEACLESLAMQTLKDLQVILVDDGSTDNSAEICRKYVEEYPFFEYHYKTNGGSASARNVGIEYATGEYLGFVDSDDWIEPNMYERMYCCAKENNDTDIVMCRVFEDETPSSRDYLFPRGGYYSFLDMQKELFPYILPCVTKEGTFRNIRWSNCIRMFRRDLVEENKIRFFEKSRRCEDLAFSFECTIVARSYYYIDTLPLYHNVANINSKSRNYTQNMWTSIRALVLHIKELVENYSLYNFVDNYHVAAYYFANLTIRNEMKCSRATTAITNIRSIINDRICQESLAYVKKTHLNKEHESVRRAVETRNASIVYSNLKYIELKKKWIPRIVRIRDNQKVHER